MSRWYEFTFRESGTGAEQTHRGQGNTRPSAERSARHRLRDAIKKPTSSWHVVSNRYVPDGER